MGGKQQAAKIADIFKLIFSGASVQTDSPAIPYNIVDALLSSNRSRTNSQSNTNSTKNFQKQSSILVPNNLTQVLPSFSVTCKRASHSKVELSYCILLPINIFFHIDTYRKISSRDGLQTKIGFRGLASKPVHHQYTE